MATTISGIVAGVNLASSLTSQSTNFLPKLWKKGAELSEQNEDLFQEFEGSGKMSPIRVQTDLSKDAGQKIYFRTRSGLYGDGGIGDELVGENSEQWRVGEYELEVDYIRHSTEWNRRTEDQTAMRDEFASGMNEDLGAWLGRKKFKHMAMMFRERLHTTSQLFAGASSGVGGINDIKTAHTVTVNEIVGWAAQLETMGAKPAQIDRDPNGNPICKFILAAVNEALTTMKQSSDYKQLMREAQSREKGTNPLFKGGYTELDGQIIKKITPIDHDGYGAIGSAMNAKALLGVAIVDSGDYTDAANTVYIKGGGNSTAAAITTAKYFEHFPLYAYRFTPADILSPSGTGYCLIYNLTGADAHKMGFFSFSANDGNKLTCAGRLHSSATGALAETTIGGVMWDTAPWVAATKLTKTHPAGSVIIQTNSYGVPIGYSFMMGADAAKRGYGRYRNERSTETHDGNFVRKTYITSVFGQSPTKRVDGRTPNALCITHAIKYAGLPAIPDVS